MLVPPMMCRMSQYLSFVAVATMAMLVPGPDTLVVLRTAVGGGARAGVWAAAGSAVGLLAWGAAAVLGLTALLTVSPAAFELVKLAGAGYLACLGVQALRARSGGADGSALRGDAFRRGLLTNLSNVKVGLFWTALAPQFLHGAGSGAAMVVTMSALGFAWLCGYAVLADRMRSVVSGRAVNVATGVMMLALAGLLLVA
jgi:threonine/homoserine/homoserine lactone efflux protein